jgi:hypothetical protein
MHGEGNGFNHKQREMDAAANRRKLIQQQTAGNGSNHKVSEMDLTTNSRKWI